MQDQGRAHSGTKRRNKNRPTPKPQSGPVQSVTVHPLIWKREFNPGQLLVIDSVTVIICNSSQHRNYMRKVLAHA